MHFSETKPRCFFFLLYFFHYFFYYAFDCPVITDSSPRYQSTPQFSAALQNGCNPATVALHGVHCGLAGTLSEKNKRCRAGGERWGVSSELAGHLWPNHIQSRFP